MYRQSTMKIEAELGHLLINILNQGDSTTERLAEELLYTLHNHHQTLGRLDLRNLSKSTALDKLTKRLIDLVLEGHRQLCIIVDIASTAGARNSRTRLEILHFLRQKLKTNVNIYNDGKRDGLIFVQLSNSPQLLASLSRHNLAASTGPHQNGAPNGNANHLIIKADVSPIGDLPVPPEPKCAETHTENGESEDEPQLIEWDIESTSGDWLVTLLPICHQSEDNLRIFSQLIEMLKPFVLGALGGYCSRVHSQEDTPCNDLLLGKQLITWLSATSLQLEIDSPILGTIVIRNLSDSLRAVQSKVDHRIPHISEPYTDSNSQVNGCEKHSNSKDGSNENDHCHILEQLLHILDVDGYHFETIEHSRMAKSHDHFLLPQMAPSNEEKRHRSHSEVIFAGMPIRTVEATSGEKSENLLKNSTVRSENGTQTIVLDRREQSTQASFETKSENVSLCQNTTNEISQNGAISPMVSSVEIQTDNSKSLFDLTKFDMQLLCVWTAIIVGVNAVILVYLKF